MLYWGSLRTGRKTQRSPLLLFAIKSIEVLSSKMTLSWCQVDMKLVSAPIAFCTHPLLLPFLSPNSSPEEETVIIKG